MSDFGAAIERLESIARAVWPDLRAGTAGFERAIRQPETLMAPELPHVFAHNPDESTEREEKGQERVEFSVELMFVTRTLTQEEVAVRLDLFAAALRADATLGGLCEYAWCRRRGVVDYPGLDLKLGALEIAAQRFA